MTLRRRTQCALLLAVSFLLGIVCLLGLTGYQALATDDAVSTSTVKVGIFTGEGYAEQDADGHWNGIDIEMTENIAQTAGIQIEFVEEDSISQALSDLDNGSIDMLADIAKTDEREQKYLFSDYEQGRTATNIFVLSDDSRWDYSDANQIATMRLSCERESIVESDFLTWCAEHGCTPNITEYDSGEAAMNAVANGEVDGYIDGEDFLNGYRSVLSFAPSSYYYIFSKDDMALKDKVDSAMGEIYTQDPLYEKELLEKYVGLNQSRSVALTKDEQAYIAEKGTVVVAVLNNDAPYFSGTESDPQGIIPEFYKNISTDTGLSFTYKIYNSQDEAIAALGTGDADIIGMFSDGITQAYDNNLIVTRKYTSVSTVMITNSKTTTDDISKIAVKARSRLTILQNIPDELKSAELVPYNTAEACFKALQDGSVNAVMIGMPSATYLINQTNSSAYSIMPVPSVTLDLCAATPNGNNTLVSILNKGISMESYSINGIIANSTVSNDTWQTTIAKIPASTIVIFSCIMILMVLGLLWGVISLVRSRKTKIDAVRSEAEAREQRIKAQALEKSAQEKSDFFSNISHDMRTPLNAVIGFIRMASKDDVPADKRKEYLTKAEQSSNLLLDLIDDTLTMSKVSSGKLQLTLEPVDNWALFESVITPIREAAVKKDIEFTADYSQTPRRMIVADRLNVQKIILNLLSNAVKYTPQGGHVDMLVTCDSSNDEALDYVITISDNGIGISQEFISHVFEPFTQEKRAGYDAVGTGLGLSIVKQLVDLMGGTIELSSEKNRGSVFVLKLHFAAATEALEPEHESERDVELNGKKVLLCEDNNLNQEIAVAILEDEGIEVSVADNGQIGVQMFTDSAVGEYDAVLMDIRMPVMGGLDATRAIRALERADASEIPIIAMTADAFSEDIKECMDAGMNGHVAKPVNPENLIDTLNGVISD